MTSIEAAIQQVMAAHPYLNRTGLATDVLLRRMKRGQKSTEESMRLAVGPVRYAEYTAKQQQRQRELALLLGPESVLDNRTTPTVDELDQLIDLLDATVSTDG